MDGFFLVDKPKGMTSFTVVQKIKKQFQLKKCGHSGTLDPNTTGLLIVACNQATKLLKFIQAEDKVYLATICFGFSSNTLDIDGRITQDIAMKFTEEALEQALETLKNKKTQIPPLVSAIKVKGKKLYEYERKQIEVELESRPVEIFEICKLSQLRWVNQHLEVDLRIHCSKGFYVRSFARDLGEALGGCAILKELRRIKSGTYCVEEATLLQELRKENLQSIEDFFPKFPRLEVNSYLAKLAKNGVVFDERQTQVDTPFYVTFEDHPIAIYEPVDTYRYKPVLIYKEGEDNL